MGASAAVEPRAACPACGGQIHPIAGRCKHCKADLTRLREARPARRPSDAVPFPLADLRASLGAGNGHAAPAIGATPYAATVVTPAVVPSGTTVAGSWSTRWPLIVAAIAILAIVASVAMLLFGGGPDEAQPSKARRYDGPAPEMTPTDPMGPQPMAPPPQGGGAPAPIQPSMPDPLPDPAPPPRQPPTASAPRDVEAFMRAAVDVGCRRMTTCAGNDPTIASYCSMATGSISQLSGQLQSLCPDYDAPAAQQCLDSLARFPCPAGTPDPTAMAATLMGLSGCQLVCASAFGSMGGALGGGAVTDDPTADDVDDPF